MNNIPKISIIVPIYNSEKYLERCLKSILSQTFQEFECILINDCSTDNSLKICNQYSSIDPRIKIINNDTNLGASLTRKIGLNISQGEYIQFVDSDDSIDSNMLFLLYESAINNNYDMIICSYNYIINGNIKSYNQLITNYNKIDLIKKVISKQIKSYLVTKFIKKELLLKSIFPEYSRSEDYVITIQNIYNAVNIGNIDLPLYYYYYNEVSLSNDINRFILGCIEENKNWQTIINYLKDKYGKNLNIFEPELSHTLRQIKKKYTENEILKNNNELLKLYPESYYLRYQYYRVLRYLKKIYENICNHTF